MDKIETIDLKRILILGNSGSGKSTLAKELMVEHGLAHRDLDEIAWLPVVPPQRSPLIDSRDRIAKFTGLNREWVIEGCYTDLLEIASQDASEVVFLNLSICDCIENAQSRPWESHKYESKEAQDENLELLISWIKQYQDREDTFSLKSHLEFFNAFVGRKVMYRANDRSPIF